ncbi:TonB-dependent receptor [candidate division KSB1 bacterium]|nr:TonB-dependent receptor [candidate division KSB1 bacterium]
MNICIFIPLFAFGQSDVKITGHVLDAETRQPLAGANVQVTGYALGAATAADGSFQIDNLLNGEYILRADFIGYQGAAKPVFITDDQPAEVSFQLQREVLEMEGVQVTAPRHAAAIEVIVLTRRDIERTQATSLGELLRYVAGVDVQDAGAQHKVSIRGSRANQVLVLLDGVKLNDDMTGEVDLAVVPLNAVERVVIRKGASAEAGSGAIGGLIQIISGAADETVSLTAKSGSYGLFALEPSLSARWQDYAVLASLQALQSDGDFPFTQVHPDGQSDKQQRRNADLWSRNLFTRLGFAGDEHQLFFRYQHFAAERGQPGRLYYLTPFARSRLTRQILGSDYRFAMGKWRMQAQANHSRRVSESSNIAPALADLSFGATPQLHFSNDVRTTQLNAGVAQQSSAWLATELGCEVKLVRFADQNLLATDSPAVLAKDKSFAVLLKQDYQFDRRKFSLRFSPVIRYDGARLQCDGTIRREEQWSPQVNAFLSYGAESRIFFAAGVGRAFRMPTFADLFYQDFRVQGAADLLPEKSLDRQVTLGSRFTAFGEWQFDMTAFRNRIADMIVWRLGSFEFFRPYNTDAELTGQEYSLTGSLFADALTLSGSYMHLQALNKNDNVTLYDKQLPFRPQHTLKAALDLELSDWRSSLLFRLVGPRYITEADTKSMPAYAVLDWTAHWRVTLGKLESQLQFAIYNVLDEEYQILRDMPLPGREWRIGVSVNYK